MIHQSTATCQIEAALLIHNRRNFKAGKTPILITTNIVGRGIDIANVGHVINYHLPSAANGGIDEYVHRIGRTGRIGHIGLATSFYNERDEELGQPLVNILLETKQPVPDFLEDLKPEGGNVDFHDNSDDSEEEASYTAGPTTESNDADADADAGPWGSNKPRSAAADNDDAWGATSAPAAAVVAW